MGFSKWELIIQVLPCTVIYRGYLDFLETSTEMYYIFGIYLTHYIDS